MINLKFLKMPMFAFFLIMIFVLICIIIYKLLGPEPPGSWNYVPFPSMSPKDLPDANSSQKSCYTSLTACDGPGICSTCGEENFECVDVLTDTQYVLNNIKVPKGQWCLPKKLKQSCGTYTGKWVWSSGNCPSGTQCWKCECLYPDLYDGPDCMVQKACINISEHSTGDQTNNILIGTTDGPYQGVEWNPNSGGDSTVLTVNPYTTTTDGSPWFKCKCNVNDVNTSYINLPHDPYTCHIDPCWEYSNYGAPGAMCIGDECFCTCNGGILAHDGKYKDRCVNDPCINGNFDETQQQCICNSITVLENCISDNFSRSNELNLPPCVNNSDCLSNSCDKSGWCNCIDTNNPLGSNCINPCIRNNCQNGSECIPDSTIDKKYRCNCVEGGQIRDCRQNVVNKIYTGQYCTDIKYNNGTAISSEERVGTGRPMDCLIEGATTGNDSNVCVSGKVRQVTIYDGEYYECTS